MNAKPDPDNSNLSFSDLQFNDLFTLEDMQRLQDLFAEAHNVASIITHPDGTPITNPSNFCHLCNNIIRKTPKGLDNCIKSDATIGRYNPEGPTIQPCLSGGLWDAGASITVGGKHIANWLIGQVRIAQMDEQQIIEYADEIGANKQDFIDALKKTPVMSDDQFEKVARMLFAFANELSENAYRNLQLKLQIAERDKAYQLLQEKEEQSGHISSTIFDVSYSCELDQDGNSSIIWMTGAVQRITGYSIDEIIALKCWGKLVLNEDTNLFRKHVVDLAPGTSSSCELRLRHKNGSVVWVESFAECYSGRGLTDLAKFYGALVDITERKLAERALKESEARFKYIFELSNVPESITLPTGEINVNKAFCDMFGYTEAELKGKKWQEVTFPDEVEIDQALIDSMLRGGKNGVRRIKRYLHKDGSILWGDVSYALIRDSDGKPLHFITTIIDVTDRKRAEDELHENMVRLELAMHVANMAWWEMDLSTGRVSFEKRKSEMLGYPPEKFNHYKDFMALIHPEDYEPTMDAMRSHLNGLSDKYEIEYRIKTISGEYKWFYDVGSVTKRDLDGSPVIISGLVLDISERKHVDEELQNSHDMLEKLAAQVPGVVYKYRLYPDRRSAFPFSSAGMYDIYEVTPEEVREDASPVFTRLHPDDYDNIVETITESARNQTLYHSEFRVILPKQGLRWRMCDAKPELLEDGSTLWYGIITDITERKLAETALKESEDRYKSFISQVSEGVYRFECDQPMDINLPLEEQVDFIYDHMFIAECNDAFLKMYGIKDQNDMLGKGHLDFHGGRNNPVNREALVTFVRNGYRIENTMTEETNQQGQTSYISNNSLGIIENNKLVRIWGTQIDITEKIRADKVQQVLYAISNAALSSSDLSDLIEFISDELGKLLDSTNFFIAFYDEETNMLSTIYEKDEKDVLQTWSAEKSATGYVVRNQKSLLLREPEIKELMESGEIEIYGTPSKVWIGVPLFGENKAIGAIVVQNYDNPDAYTEKDKLMLEFISHQVSICVERKKAEQELNAAVIKAKESDRLKSAFLANMSHEIRTPLNSIIGFSELLTDSDFGQVERTEFAQIINKSGNNLLSILSDIMDLSKIEAGQVQVMKSTLFVSKLLAEIQQEFLYNAAAKGIELKLDSLNPPTVIINGDETKIRQIIANLINNALKFTHAGYVELGVRILDNQVCFHIKDTGIGIPAEFQQQIFERFRQIESSHNRKYGGNGLGLAISKSLVELLGGKIWVESEINRGTTFYFTVPN